jgi:hypothetical protein
VLRTFVASYFSPNWRREDFGRLTGLTSKCIEKNDPLNNKCTVGLGALGGTFPYRWVRPLFGPKLGAPLTTVPSVGGQIVGGAAGKCMRGVGRVASPVFIGYGLGMAGIECACAARCASDPNDPVNAYDAFGLLAKEGKPKPPKWNPDDWQPGRENCCAYAYDRPGRTLQPGELGGMSKYPDFKQGGYTCAELAKRIKADFPNNPNVGAPKDGKCPAGTHKVKPWVQPDGREYHMQRQDDDGKWSDMPFPKGPKRCNPNKPDQKGDKPCDEICVPDAARY